MGLVSAVSLLQAEGPAKGIEVVAAGEIVRIDAGKRSFTLKSMAPEPEHEQADEPREALTIGGLSVSVSRVVTRGPVTVGVGIGEPDAGPASSPNSRPFPPADPSSSPPSDEPVPRYVNTRIWTTDNTRIHEDDREIPFSALKKGDPVTVRGTPKGDDIEAAEVLRRANEVRQ